jgi:translation initiation factor 1
MRLFAGTPYDRPPKCERCGALESDCKCPRLAAGQAVRLAVEKRKKGKLVTVIRGLTAKNNDLPALLSRLKSQCGAGGAVQEDRLEIQGDHVERIGAELSELGYRVKS